MPPGPDIIDLAYILLFAVCYPLLGYYGFRQLQQRVANGEHIEVSSLYRKTITGHWIMLAAGILLWLHKERGWSDTGFVIVPGPPFLLGLLIAALVLILLGLQLRQVQKSSPGQKAQFRKQVDFLSVMLPKTRSDLREFYALSFTAGVVEEIIWRGMLIYYLQPFMPLWLAGLISAVGFGLAHAYQGMSQVPKIMAVGGLFSVVYLVSGSIWIPIVLHILVDVLQGRLAFELLNESDAKTEPAPA